MKDPTLIFCACLPLEEAVIGFSGDRRDAVIQQDSPVKPGAEFSSTNWTSRFYLAKVASFGDPGKSHARAVS